MEGIQVHHAKIDSAEDFDLLDHLPLGLRPCVIKFSEADPEIISKFDQYIEEENLTEVFPYAPILVSRAQMRSRHYPVYRPHQVPRLFMFEADARKLGQTESVQGHILAQAVHYLWSEDERQKISDYSKVQGEIHVKRGFHNFLLEKFFKIQEVVNERKEDS